MNRLFTVGIALLFSPAVLDECDSSKLDMVPLVECITVEGAAKGDEHRQAEYAKIGTSLFREEQRNILSDSQKWLAGT